MLSSDVFKIVIGESWRAAASGDPEQLVIGPGESIDFGRIRGAVDIVVDGTSICGRTDEDSIFFLVRDLLYAVEKLSCSDETARVSFYEGPWELVLQRLGHKVYITFYRGGRRPQVVVKNHTVLFERLAEGVVSSAGELLEQATKLDPKAYDDPLIAGIGTALERTKKLIDDGTEIESSSVPTSKRLKSTRWKAPRSERSFSFGFQFTASATDLLAPGRPTRGSNLNALLFNGRLAVHARGRYLVLGEGFLFLQTERLLASLRQLFTAWEEGRPMSVRLISDGLVVGIRLGADDSLVVSLMDSSSEDAIVALNDLTPWEYADAVLGLARELRRLVVEVSSHQRRNLRLEAFSREVRSLTSWAKEQRRGALINEDIDRYRNLPELRRKISSPMMIGEANRLRFEERWRIDVESLDLAGTMLCGNMAIVSARGLILGIEAGPGTVAWRRETDRSEVQFKLAGPDGLVRVAPSGHVEMIDLYSGVRRWHTMLSPRSGGPPVLLVIDNGPVPGLVIAAEEERKIVALDVRSGEPCWRFSLPRGGSLVLRRYGGLLYVSSSDSQFSAVDVEDGSLVWRFTDRTRFVIPPAIIGDTILAIGGRPGRPEGRMYALNAFSGGLKWSVAIGGSAMTSPIVADGVALLPIRVGRRYEFIGVDVASGEELWRMDCAGWADPSALMALDKFFIINSAGGALRAIAAKDGKEQWMSTLGPSCSDDVPLSLKIVLRGGMLFVPSDTVYIVRPEDGRVVHSLGGEAPVPDLLQVDPTCAVFVAEDSGHIAMYNLLSRLTLVS